jgi:hypothetical protein
MPENVVRLKMDIQYLDQTGQGTKSESNWILGHCDSALLVMYIFKFTKLNLF